MLAEQVKYHENPLDLEAKGLACCGGVGCEERFAFEDVRALLEDGAQLELDTRLRHLKAPGPPSSVEPAGDGATPTSFEEKRLTKGIEGAFNLCCPEEGCGYTLDEIEACNAATCSNDKCQSTFCYLCLQLQDNAAAAHAHLRENHGKGYWELRDGHTGLVPQEGEYYTEVDHLGKPYTYVNRYHWLLARKNLTSLFKEKVEEEGRTSALKSKEKMLKQEKMWPMPAGVMTADWIQEVAASNLPRDHQIELLQNEYVYRAQKGDRKNTALLDAELQRLGGKVLASLDLKDAQGIHAQVRGQAQAALLPAVGDHRAPVAPAAQMQAAQVGNFEPIFDGQPGFVPEFAQFGAMYRLGGLVLSGLVPPPAGRRGRSYPEAMRACPAGTRLPTRDEWRMIGQAMTMGGRYQPRIPDMRDRWFWFSSRDGDDYAWFFYGNDGSLGLTSSNDCGDVRCVAQPRG